MRLLAAADEPVVAKGLTAVDWLQAGIVFAAGLVLGTIVRNVLTRVFREDDDDDPGGAVVAGRLAASVIVLAALVYALGLLDVRLGPLLGAIGIGGIAIAFAAQDILANFMASIILQTRRPFRRGDQILTNDLEGAVEDVNFRTVVLRTYDGERVLVPCAEVLRSPITNYTATGRRRTTLAVGVAYGSDLDRARRVILDAIRGLDGVYERPPAEVHVEAFGESSVDLAVRWWHAPDIATLWRVRTAVATAVHTCLDEAGITIPFPQRVLHFATDDDSGPVRVDLRQPERADT